MKTIILTIQVPDENEEPLTKVACTEHNGQAMAQALAYAMADDEGFRDIMTKTVASMCAIHPPIFESFKRDFKLADNHIKNKVFSDSLDIKFPTSNA